MARRYEYATFLPFRPRQSSCGARPETIDRSNPGRMAGDRASGRRNGTNKILVFDNGRNDRLRRVGWHDKAALAYRARLSGAEAGSWVGALRREGLARVPSSRHTLHCGLRLPDHGKGRFSPLWSPLPIIPRAICRSRELPTPRCRRFALNAMYKIRLQP